MLRPSLSTRKVTSHDVVGDQGTTKVLPRYYQGTTKVLPRCYQGTSKLRLNPATVPIIAKVFNIPGCGRSLKTRIVQEEGLNENWKKVSLKKSQGL